MTTTSTRRAVLAGAAALPALSLPAIAEPDPIFAAIERHRNAEAAFDAAVNVANYGPLAGDAAAEEVAGELCEVAHSDYAELVAMTPTTTPGCAALLRYVEQHETKYARYALFQNLNDQVRGPGRDLLSRIVAVLDPQTA